MESSLIFLASTLLKTRNEFLVTKSAICLVSVGSKDGAVVRALAFHHCGPGSNLSVNAICGLSLLLVLSLTPRDFSSGTPVLPTPQKPLFPNSNSTRNQVDEEPLCVCATCKSLFYLFNIIIRAEFSSRQVPVHWARPCCRLLSVA